MPRSLANLAQFPGSGLGARDCFRREVTEPHGRNRNLKRAFGAKALKVRIELEIVTGDLLTGGDVDERIAAIKNVKIGVRLPVMVHELAVVAVDDTHAGNFQMRIAVTREVVLHMRGQRRDLLPVDEDVELRVEHPHLASGRNELAGKDAEALNFTLCDIGADEHHVRCLRLAPIFGWRSNKKDAGSCEVAVRPMR